MFSADDVVTLVEVLQRKQIAYWIAGGWGIDALVRRITREHHDLDLHIDVDRIADVTSFLSERGYAKTIDEAPVRIAMTHPSGTWSTFFHCESTLPVLGTPRCSMAVAG